jgi:hypothetical protein
MHGTGRWVWACALAAAGCGGPTYDYVVSDVPRVDVARRDARADVASDRGAPPAADAGAADVTVTPDVPALPDVPGVTDVPPLPDIPIVDVPPVDRPPVCMDTDLDGISDDLEGAPSQHTSGVMIAPNAPPLCSSPSRDRWPPAPSAT